MGFGMDSKAKDFRQEEEPIVRLACVSCARPIKSGWRCERCRDRETPQL